jgi:hypothetical protein
MVSEAPWSPVAIHKFLLPSVLSGLSSTTQLDTQAPHARILNSTHPLLKLVIINHLKLLHFIKPKLVALNESK